MSLNTKKAVYEAVAKSLREFGYPDASAAMVKDTYGAMLEERTIPHGIIGKFAESQLRDVWEPLQELPD